jgi:hypothetical protein
MVADFHFLRTVVQLAAGPAVIGQRWKAAGAVSRPVRPADALSLHAR